MVTESQLLTVSLAGFDVREVYSSPEFNDLHSVHVLDDSLALTCTGRDLIMFVQDGKVLDRRIDTKPARWVEDSVVTTVDWRERNTQPHDTHPNYFWMHDEAAWVTRGNRGDIVRVDSHERMVISNKVVHDGFFNAGSWWATSVNGYVHELDPEGKLIRSINVGRVLEPKDLRPGWCRGLHVTDDLLIVGFSAIRATRLRRNLEWLASAGQHRDRAPTQVAFIDRVSGRLVKSIRVDGADIHSIFSTIPVNL